ncbi:hypothetical protein GHK92_01235 [Nocardioides sp. dk4132]|uniref:hypothetical protein n=1 Tax=unclassified Nocardioides TaxID=2615069 RepID=UPI001295F378|nr:MULTISPECIES: hypothetical protein [unclassified Nocardioides]MQW74490.1 hypothetical protein [Nocardioides sp. dk4132]QGA06420.1 hypothetical protein GFH29_02680 [Nocardioides sp. dk884]
MSRILVAPAVAVAATFLTLPVLTAPDAAALSCAMPAPVIRDADVLVTGRIVDGGSDQDGSRILVEVETVHRAPADAQVPERWWLDVTLAGWSTWTDAGGAIPAGYSNPRRWVFAPDDGSVNPCTAWPAGSVRVPAGEPVGAAVAPSVLPGDGSTTRDTRAAWTWVGAGLGASLLGLGAVAAASVVRRRRGRA